MGIHQCPLIVRSCKWLDIKSFICTLHDVLRYLGTHWHQWWDCLALVNNINQWSVIQWFLSMFDINTFIRMVRIVPSGFVACEDCILCMTPSTVLKQHTSSHMRVPQFYFQLSSFTSSNQAAVQFLHFTLCDPAAVSATFLLHSSSTFWVSGGMLFSKSLIM